MAKAAAPYRVKGKRVYRSFSQDELDRHHRELAIDIVFGCCLLTMRHHKRG